MSKVRSLLWFDGERKRWKSVGARSGECGGCWRTSHSSSWNGLWRLVQHATWRCREGMWSFQTKSLINTGERDNLHIFVDGGVPFKHFLAAVLSQTLLSTFRRSSSNFEGLPLEGLSSRSRSPFLNFANHFRAVNSPTTPSFLVYLANIPGCFGCF